MRDLVFLRGKAKQQLQQLYPKGRAFQSPDGSDGDIIIDVKSGANANFLYEVENFVASILPDSELFNITDARNWERRLGLDYDPETLTLEERKAEILRKLSYPGGFRNTLTLEFLEYQLRKSLFDVRVYRNPGLTQPADTELIANSVEKEEGFTISNFYHTFIIAGSTPTTEAVIESRRRNEFIRKVLRYKPMNMICFLNSTISKADGTFKLKFGEYVCELIEETPPYATNVNVSGIYEVGRTLTGSYTYNDNEGDAESGTTFRWYRADDQSGLNAVVIAGATATTYTLVSADGGKHIAFAVTPKNIKATGSEYLSDYTPIIDLAIKPVITFYADKLTNRLTWTMADNTQNSGTWEVEFRQLGETIPLIQTGTGSPRNNMLPVGAYNNNVIFRVRRISIPTTDWSEPFNAYVEHVGLYEIAKANVLIGSTPQSGFCVFDNQYTTEDLLSPDAVPVTGTQLYFRAASDLYYKASLFNIENSPTTVPAPISNGIQWIRFAGDATGRIWDVNPNTGIITGVSTNYSCPI
jgi:hypothetical protein